MRTVTLTETTQLADVLPTAASDGVVLMRDGHAVALVVPLDDETLVYVRDQEPDFVAAITRGREQIARGEFVSHEQLMRELEAEDSASPNP